jgi:hypothetical protein
MVGVEENKVPSQQRSRSFDPATNAEGASKLAQSSGKSSEMPSFKSCLFSHASSIVVHRSLGAHHFLSHPVRLSPISDSSGNHQYSFDTFRAGSRHLLTAPQLPQVFDPDLIAAPHFGQPL